MYWLVVAHAIRITPTKQTFVANQHNILAVFALTPFLGDNTRFFKNGRHFPNLSASRGSSFCGSSNRLVGLL